MGITKLKLVELSPSSDADSPIRAVFCLKNKLIDMKKIEELEDCFILDFDPSQPADFSNISLSKDSDLCDDKDVSILAENGQVACRDYPHSRHLCVKFPFEKTPHESHCDMCFCYVCDMAAPCKEWTKGLKHCDATEDGDQIWRLLRAKKVKAQP
ncbi:hypothetical protein SOVF_093750 [Spinacia oleracea]|uniref:RPM1 interacting protein 13 n=1 Tax=Spinacia oleracea TaxID=3562 RepID=A0A9R0JN65_SPIOL|nr:RPM1 interacting protein 13-like [Spinacia oleracea]KNA15948.1 hypothetical protein SOVF_093750 [Spinacia oleracea]